MQRRRFVAGVSGLAVSLWGCSRSTSNATPSDAEVYADFMVEVVRSAAAIPQAIVVRGGTVAIKEAIRFDPLWDAGITFEEKVAKQAPPAATPAVLQSFIQNASRVESIDWNAVESRARLPIRVVGDLELEGLLSDSLANGWKRFYDAYPKSNGVMAFSRVGWDARSGQALMYAQNGCGTLCGIGMLILLSRGPKGWSILDDRRLWVS